MDRTRLIYCRMGKCFTEVVVDSRNNTVCFFGKSGQGNTCWEPQQNFVSIPFEPLLYRIFGFLKRLRWIRG